MVLDSISKINNYASQKTNQAQPVAATQETAEIKDETAEYTEKVSSLQSSQKQDQSKTSEEAYSNELSDNTDKAQPSLEQIKKAIDTINKKANNSTVQFGIHEATNRITIKIVDKDTKKVIKEVPAEKTLDMIAKAWEMAGILVDEKR